MPPPTLAPLYLMKVGEATLCLKNHLVLSGIAKQLRLQLHMAGLSIEEDHYVREFATREQASVFIQNSSAKKSVFVVIDDNVAVNRHAGAEYPQPNILYFTGSFIAKDIVFGVGQQFKSRCDEFAKRLIEEDSLFAASSQDTSMERKDDPAYVSVDSKISKIESGNTYDTSSQTLVSKKEGFECDACMKGNHICFCLMPIVQLLVEQHPPCVDHLLRLVEEYVNPFIPYQVSEAKMSREHLEATNESGEDVKSAHSHPKEPEPIETARFNAYIEPQLERLKLEESLIKSLDIKNLSHSEKDNNQFFDKMPELDEFEDEEIAYERDTSSDQSPDENRLPSLASDSNEQLSPASGETLSISSMNDGSPRVFFTESTKENTTSSPLSKAESNDSSKSYNKISKALVRTPMMEEEGTDPIPYTSPLHQMPVPLLGTNYQEILMEIEQHNITMSQLRASFAANLSRAHEVISQQKLLADQLYHDITTVNAAIENELKASEALTVVDRPTLNCWGALLVYHSKLTNLLLLAAHSSLELPVTNLVFLRAATKKIVDVNPGQTVKEKLALAIAMLGAAHEKHDLGELIPTFFREAHKISVYIMVIRLEQVLSRVQADPKAIDISMQDASRLVQTAQETLKALEQNIAEKYAAFFNVVCHILQERSEMINEPFPDFAFTSAIEL